jgi:hypothetical protein
MSRRFTEGLDRLLTPRRNALAFAVQLGIEHTHVGRRAWLEAVRSPSRRSQSATNGE